MKVFKGTYIWNSGTFSLPFHIVTMSAKHCDYDSSDDGKTA